MGAQWFCDQCGAPLRGNEAVPMAIGYPKPEPLTMVTPMGQTMQVVQGPGGMPMPYKEDPRHIFENFQICHGCAYSLAIIFKEKAKRIRYVVAIDNKPLDA